MSEKKKTKNSKKKFADKGRKWLITDWMKDDADRDAAIKRVSDGLNPKQVRYAVWQIEKAEKNKEHVQLFVHFNRSITMSTLKNRLGSHSLHAEQVKDDEVAAHYCEKPVDGCDCKHCKKAIAVQEVIYGPVEIGEKPDYKKGGTTKPTEALLAMIKAGHTDQDLLEEAPWALLRHGRGIDRLRFADMEKKAKEFRQVEVIILSGDAGTGKTVWAIQNSVDGDYYKPDLSKNTIWYDGYQGQRTLILDDFRGQGLRFDNLLQILDGHKLMLPIKGGHTYALWTRVIITSNTIPSNWYRRLKDVDEEWFNDEQDDFRVREQRAFWRRINLHVVNLNIVADWPDCVDNIQRAVDRAIAALADGGQQADIQDDGDEGDSAAPCLAGIW